MYIYLAYTFMVNFSRNATLFACNAMQCLPSFSIFCNNFKPTLLAQCFRFHPPFSAIFSCPFHYLFLSLPLFLLFFLFSPFFSHPYMKNKHTYTNIHMHTLTNTHTARKSCHPFLANLSFAYRVTSRLPLSSTLPLRHLMIPDSNGKKVPLKPI